MDFIEIVVSCSQEFSEIFMAEMADLEFDTFEEFEGGFKAYIGESNFAEDSIDELFIRYAYANATYKKSVVVRENWNKLWEENYDPIFVDDKIVVKAPFHNIEKEYPYEILITPKMSFGTGHHSTTYLMLSNQLKINHKDKKVFDVGCGTGILAIMATKLGANNVIGSDIDEWCIENSIENAAVNAAKIPFYLGDVSQLEIGNDFDILLANINMNVLLSESADYIKALKIGGFLVISGFYVEDVEEIGQKFVSQGLEQLEISSRNNWASIVFKRLV